jgi:D-glycero-D-manno-heptose 1,7-bisphosphate phosphatase
MKGQKRKLDFLRIGKDWTLFLDRDGVINKKIEGDYVRTCSQFEFLPGVFESLQNLSKIFGKIIIVRNQRGIGRGLMTEEDLKYIHSKILGEFSKHKIQIHKIYYCPHDYEKEECNCRKPKIGTL